jgi:uncharacterized iron-regulated membrane protein
MLLRRWRPSLVKIHRWLGLTAGLLLMLNAFTGSLMLGARPLDRVLNAQLFEVKPAGQAVPLETLRQSLLADYGSKARFTIRPPREPEESILVYVTSDSWEGQAHYDPYSGRKLGAREEHEGFANALFEFHSALLAGDTGKTVLAFNTVTMLAMLVTGVLLWWPARSWRGAFSVSLKGGLLRSLFDLHRVGGVVLGAWVLVCVLTGTWMAWRPVSQWVTQVAGQQQVLPPTVKAGSAPQGRAATADEMVATANAALPGGVVGYLGLPAKPTAPVRIRKKLDDDPHPNGLSSVWLHPHTGEVIRVDRWSDLDVGTRSYAWIYPLHSGKLAGVVGVLATAAGGLLLFGFGVSGTWLWWLRRRMRMPKRQL